MELLRSGVDRAVIALWLGHESVETTQMYLDADLALKERALARTAPRKAHARRYLSTTLGRADNSECQPPKREALRREVPSASDSCSVIEVSVLWRLF